MPHPTPQVAYTYAYICTYAYLYYEKIYTHAHTCVISIITLVQRYINYRAIDIIESVYNTILLVLFLYFGTLFAFYGFLIISVSDFKHM